MTSYHAVALFNDWLGGSSRTSPPRDDLEQRALEHMPMLDGYRAGDDLLRSQIEFDVEADSAENACSQVFRELNVDERPNGHSERSLSVGDLVALYSADVLVAVYAVEAVGFRRLNDDEAAVVEQL